jgi:hypothetical protein
VERGLRSKIFGLIPLLLVFVGLAVLVAYFNPEPTKPPILSFELPYPFSFTHSIFLSVSCLVAAYFFGRGFIANGSIDLLVLGGGSIVLGLGFLLSQVLGYRPYGGPNELVGISSVSFLMSGIFYGAFATFSLSGRRSYISNRRGFLTILYAVSLLLVLGTTLVFELGLAPAFFATGIGPTGLRQQVLGLATLLYAFTSAALMRSYTISKNDILYWFSLGLGAVSVGFLSALFGKIPGGLYSWLGRFALELGGVFIIIAIFRAYRGKKSS